MRFRRLMAASMAGVMAVSSAIVCQISASAADSKVVLSTPVTITNANEATGQKEVTADFTTTIDELSQYENIAITFTINNADEVNSANDSSSSNDNRWKFSQVLALKTQELSSGSYNGNYSSINVGVNGYGDPITNNSTHTVNIATSDVIAHARKIAGWDDNYQLKVFLTAYNLGDGHSVDKIELVDPIVTDTTVYAEQNLTFPEYNEVSKLPGQFIADNISGINARIVVNFTSNKEGWGLKLIDGGAETTDWNGVISKDGSGIGTQSVEFKFKDFVVPETVWLNGWGIENIDSIVIYNDETKPNVYQDSIAATEVKLDKTTLIFTEGGAAQTLKATVSPDNATDKTVTWKSSNTEVATVTNGVVTPVGVGTATITATANGGTDVKATCEVTVNAKTYGIKVSDVTNGTVAVDKTTAAEGETVTVTTTPATGYDLDTITVTAADKTTVEVTNKTFTMPAQAVTVSATFKEITVTGVTLKESTTIIVGGTETLAPDITPDTALNKAVTWKSSDTSVATVDSTGKVTAVKAGTATITATTSNGKTASCTVTVTDQEVAATGITLNKSTTTIEAGKTETLTAVITPDNSTDKAVWTSSDETIAKVENGVVTAIKAGTVKITAKAGSFSAECEVTVTPAVVNVTGVTLNKTTAELKPEETVTLTATVAPANATDKTVTWTSSDEKVATVKDGVVTAVSAGTATITAKAGDKTATCTVTVKETEPASTNEVVDLLDKASDLGTDWSKSVEIAKTDVSVGDTIRIKVEVGSADYHQIKVMDGDWNVLTSLTGVNEWGCVDVSSDGYVEFVLNAADAKLISEKGLIISGYDITVNDAEAVLLEDATVNVPVVPKGGTKVDAVYTKVDENGNKVEQIAVFAISEEDAENYDSYVVTITRSSDNKKVTVIVDECYKYVTYNDGSKDVRVSSSGAYTVLLDITGISSTFGNLTIEIAPNTAKG